MCALRVCALRRAAPPRMGRGCDGKPESNFDRMRESARTIARDRRQSQCSLADRSGIRARQQIVQNEANCPQLAERGGALRFCALRRAARAEGRFGRMQDFLRLQTLKTQRTPGSDETNPFASLASVGQGKEPHEL
jgi:hypothetical protein